MSDLDREGTATTAIGRGHTSQPLVATATAAAPRTAVRIPELDGLRGVAILTVVSLHYLWSRIPLPPAGVWRGVVAQSFVPAEQDRCRDASRQDF